MLFYLCCALRLRSKNGRRNFQDLLHKNGIWKTRICFINWDLEKQSWNFRIGIFGIWILRIKVSNSYLEVFQQLAHEIDSCWELNF